MKQLPVQQCPYCGNTEFRVGWQHQEAIVTFKRNGILGNRLKHLICGQCGAVVYSCVAEPQKFPSAESDW